MRSFPWVLGTIFLLSGCSDPASGTGTSADIPSNYDVKCVETALKSTPGVGDVSPMRVTDSSAGEKIFSWDYDGEFGAALELRRTENVTHYLNTNVRMGRDKERGPKFEPLMNKVNASVETQCGMPISKNRSVESFPPK